LAPKDALINGYVCDLIGGQVPFILRESGEDFMLVGEAYVHGLMNREALELEDCAVEKITLV
jgi:hypothetical protein